MATAQSPAPYDTFEADRTRQYEKVRHDPGVVRILHTLRSSGVRLAPFDAVDTNSLDNGYAWHAGKGFLYLFPYRTTAKAKAAEARFRKESVYGMEPGNLLYRCRTAVAIYVGGERRVSRPLTRLCGKPHKPGTVTNER